MISPVHVAQFMDHHVVDNLWRRHHALPDGKGELGKSFDAVIHGIDIVEHFVDIKGTMGARPAR